MRAIRQIMKDKNCSYAEAIHIWLNLQELSKDERQKTVGGES